MTITASPSAPCVTRLALELPWDTRSPAVARRSAARWLESVAYPRTADAVLVVSELVTNAVRHARGPSRLVLTDDGECLDIALTDYSEDMPDVHQPTDFDRPGGFGLKIMQRLGDSVRVVPRIGGKTVHVALRVPVPPHDRRRPP
ncbi:ATP-binding protein [Streptomyces sp. NPDC057695]|uniref:ATP-binding protein n=1 Tax=Streptomyces sp. NPDC057695 TaxID=3346217 RepID=UPI003679A7C3